MLRSILLIFCLLHAITPYKILVYNPKYRHSHSNFLGRVADILAEEGHDVTSLISVLAPKLKDGSTISKVIYVHPDAETAAHYEGMMSKHSNLFETPLFNLRGAFKTRSDYGILWSSMCRTILDEPGLMEKLKAEQFDVMITENTDMCGMGISHVIAAKSVIMISTCVLYGPQYDEMGVPPSLSFNPSLLTKSLNPHSISDRFWNLVSDLQFRIQFGGCRTYVEDVFQEKYGPEFPTLNELSSRVAYGMANTEPLIDYGKPTLHRIVEIPGLGSKEPQPLDEHWTKVMSLRDKAVLISFGSVVQSRKMSAAAKNSILNTIQAFPNLTFIWKYEDPEDEFAKGAASKVDNLVMSTWTPQVDLLNHDRMALFMSHGGMGSVQETSKLGVPAMFIPLFGDQPRNAGMMEYNGLGKVFDKFQLGNFEKLYATVKELLENSSYRENSKRVARMLAQKPFSSRELLVKHVEFAAQFGPSAALRPASHDMTFVELYNLDIIVFILAIVLGAVVFLTKLLCRICRRSVLKQKLN